MLERATRCQEFNKSDRTCKHGSIKQTLEVLTLRTPMIAVLLGVAPGVMSDHHKMQHILADGSHVPTMRAAIVAVLLGVAADVISHHYKLQHTHTVSNERRIRGYNI